MMTEGKPLTPLSDGIVLLVGVKASNFDDEIRSHPRVMMWSSQEEHWTSKDLPSNTRAVFMTRFIGHAAFNHIVREARKKRITIFNPLGTGVITQRVRELLSIHPVQTTIEPVIHHNEVVEMKETEQVTKKHGQQGKLKALIPFIDFSHTNIDNAKALFAEAKKLNIDTTVLSLAQLVSHQRRKNVKVIQNYKPSTQKDVSIEIFDRAMKDMRDFVVATVAENNSLKARLESLKKAIGGL